MVISRRGRHGSRRFASVIAVTSLLLAGCTGFPLLPPPAAEPAGTGGDSESMAMDLCSVFFSVVEQQFGGMPAAVETVYIARDGTVQQSRETTDDTVLFLREGEADVSAILDTLSRIDFPPPEQRAEATEGVLLLPETSGPTVLVEATFCDGSPKQWVGSMEEVPPVLAGAMADARALAETVPVRSIRSGALFIRAQLLPSEKVEQLRRADLVLDIDVAQLESSVLLDEAIARQRRLIEVTDDEALYGDIPLSFTPLRSAHVSVNERVYQIRHLLAGGP